jgi:hypothetical protein
MTPSQLEFRSDEKLVKAWRETWNLPHMRLGREILFRAYIPNPLDTPKEGDPMVNNALENVRREGYYDYERFIESLGTLHIQRDPLPQPFTIPSRKIDTD